MNRVTELTGENTDIPIGTIVRLEESASGTDKIYMLVESGYDRGKLVNLSNGRVWSYEDVTIHKYKANYAEFKEYCFVPFHIIESVVVAKGGSVE